MDYVTMWRDDKIFVVESPFTKRHINESSHAHRVTRPHERSRTSDARSTHTTPNTKRHAYTYIHGNNEKKKKTTKTEYIHVIIL